MTFRGLTMLVRTDDGKGAPQMALPADMWRRVWPVEGPIDWPPPQAASDEDIHVVATRLRGWLRMPEVPVFHRDPNGWQQTRRS